MERCPSGLKCALGKRVLGNQPQVRILSSPPVVSHTKQIVKFVSYFYLWDCFGIIIDFERPQLENPSRLNWINLQRDKNGNWIKTKK